MKRLSKIWIVSVALLSLLLLGFPSGALKAGKFNLLGVAAVTNSISDADSDGLSDSDELALKTDPNDVDSDCDGLVDGAEVGSVVAPTDSDHDGIIDALESNRVNSGGGSAQDQSDPTVGPQSSCAKFHPFALPNNGVDATRAGSAHRWGRQCYGCQRGPANQSTTFPKLDGTQLKPNDAIQLYDDGTHGDLLASDDIWTRNGFTAATSLLAGQWRTFEFNILKVTDNGVMITIDRNSVTSSFGESVLGIVNQSDVQTPTVVGPKVQQVSNLVNLIEPLISTPFVQTRTGLRAATKGFYANFTDDYDFLYFFPEAPAIGDAFGLSFATKNDVQFIGSSLFDNSAAYGSASKLQSAIFLNFGANGPTLHETLHHWAVAGLASLGFTQCVDAGHWGVAGVGEGQLGGFDGATLVDNHNGSYTMGLFGTNANGGDGPAYAPLERYLAGLAAPSDVSPIKLLENVDCASRTVDFLAGTVTYKATGIKTVTIDDIMTTLGGPRTPAFPASQTSFRGAFIVVSQQPLNGSEMAYFNDWAKLFGASTGNGSLKSFREASGNVATMDTTIGAIKLNQPPVAASSSLTVTVGSPQAGTLSASDADGDPLTYHLMTDGKGEIFITDVSSGTFVYTPNDAASGNDSFTFQASDRVEDSNVATITVTIVEPSSTATVTPTMTPTVLPGSTATATPTPTATTTSPTAGENRIYLPPVQR